jgi:hypothetical protein
MVLVLVLVLLNLLLVQLHVLAEMMKEDLT